MSFLADFDHCLTELGDADADTMNELNAAAIWYRTRAKKDKGFAKMFLKKNGSKAVPFDKGTGFCILKEDDHFEKLHEVVSGPQLTGIASDKNLLAKTETAFNKELQVLYKNGKIEKEFYERSRSCGAQPARLYGLAKVHKERIPLRPVLSLPGSSYEKLTNDLSRLFKDIPECQIKCSTQKIKEAISEVTLEQDEILVSLDVKSLYINVPVDESIAQVANLIYRRKNPDFDRNTFVRLMGLAVENVIFQSGGTWYKQVDGLAMGSKLAVYLSNILLRQFEPYIGGAPHEEEESEPSSPILTNSKDPCGKCGKIVT